MFWFAETKGMHVTGLKGMIFVFGKGDSISGDTRKMSKYYTTCLKWDGV